jgi:hypothetical protein
VVAKISDDLFIDEIDLILVDWDLGGGSRGYEAIEKIREVAPYKDVVFYSANTTPKELRRSVAEKELEGVYCASRDGLVDEFTGVFESLIKKVLDLDHTRGIVMGATSDIDHMVQECLRKMHDSSNQTEKQALVERVLALVEERADRLVQNAKDLRTAASLEKCFEAFDLFTAFARLRVLAGLLKEERFRVLVEYRDAVVAYQQEVRSKRNQLGHRVLVPEGKPGAVVDGAGNTVSVQAARELRKKILDSRQGFRDLFVNLQNGDEEPDA